MPPKEQAPKPTEGLVDIVGQKALRAATEAEAEKLRKENPGADVRVVDIKAGSWENG